MSMESWVKCDGLGCTAKTKMPKWKVGHVPAHREAWLREQGWKETRQQKVMSKDKLKHFCYECQQMGLDQ